MKAGAAVFVAPAFNLLSLYYFSRCSFSSSNAWA